ncbi:MAG: hypothetical protein K6U78_03985 [Anaerolineae bacterium]|jgi:hypothetical protein|nr:hypothetical protein [Anaerolineae bacterium]
MWWFLGWVDVLAFPRRNAGRGLDVLVGLKALQGQLLRLLLLGFERG